MHISSRVLIYATAIMAVLVYGVLGSFILGQYSNFSVPIKTPIEALYFTVVTISTVGYGDIVPVTDLGRIFTIILIISGLSIFLSAITVLSGDFLSARVERLYSGLSRVERRHLKNHIVLIGYEATNQLVAERLKEQRRNFIIVTVDKLTADSLREKGYIAYLADYTNKEDMQKFMLEKASDIVVDIHDSSKTIYVVLVVKKLAKHVRVSVVVQSPEAEAHLADLEIDSLVNPTTIAADMMTKLLDKDQDEAHQRRRKAAT